MKVYEVGGAVRDALLGLPVKETTSDEYALARTERKVGRGYTGFTFDTAATVTLEQDLERRDLTINAIARDNDGTLIDPWGGRRDLEDRVLRHVSPAFAEDPLRVLRVARFAARFAKLGFTIAPETQKLMSEIVASGEIEALKPERVWQETAKALGEDEPAAYISVLRSCGALARVFPEVDALFGVPQSERWHPEIDTGVHVLLALMIAAKLTPAPTVRFAVLTHDLGKGTTPKALLPAHHGHERRSEELLDALCARLPVPNRFRDLALHVARHHGTVHRAAELKPRTVLEVITAVDALRQPERFEEFLLACEADMRGRKGLEERPYTQGDIFRTALRAARSVDATRIREERNVEGEALGKALHDARAPMSALTVGRELRVRASRADRVPVARRSTHRSRQPCGAAAP